MDEAVPALQHVIHRLGNGGVAREPGTFGPHPVLELRDQRRAPLLAHRQTLLGGRAVDGAFDVEQRVDPLHSLQRQRRDRWCLLSAPLVRRNVGELVELAPAVTPAERLGHGSRRSAVLVEPPVAGIGVGLQNPEEGPKMLNRVIAGAIPGVSEQHRRRVPASERRVVAHIDPGPRGVGLPLRQYRHRGVVAVQTRSRQHMVRDQIMKRLQSRRAGAYLIGQRRQAEIDPFARVALPLSIQRLMLPVLLEENHCQQVRARPAAGCRVEGRRRLRYPLTVPARELLAHRLNHLPPARDHLQRLRHVLADFGQLVRPTARAGRGHGNHHALARQMVGERFARGPAADEPLDLSAPRRRLLSRQLVLGCTRRELVERELHLVEQALLALRAPAVERRP